MKAIIEEIKSQIKNHKSVQSSILNDIAHWKRAHYIFLAEIVSKELSQSIYLQGERKYELGNTISFITLQRFFENDYQSLAINDLRFIKTLHKFCIFLGFYDLNEYIISTSLINNIRMNREAAKTFCDVIKKLCLAEYEVIKGLPKKSLDELYAYSFKKSRTIKKIKSYIDKFKEANYYFDKDYKEAKFELISCDLIANENNLKIIKTVENWDYVLKNNEDKTIYYKAFNSQTYYLKKDKNGNWKVWDNYNPNEKKVKINFI